MARLWQRAYSYDDPVLSPSPINAGCALFFGTLEEDRRRSSLVKTYHSVLALFFSLLCACIPAFGSGSDDASPRVPIFLELFTSEGCSSCPPADAFLERMDAQPIPGAQLIVLSEHVDYWDHSGWKDPYSSHAFTERQVAYVQALHLSEPATPQIILNGSSLLRGDSHQIQQMLIQATSSSTVPVKITSMAVEPGSPPVVRLHVSVPGSSLNRPSELLLAVALDHAESDVLRGENGGKHLEYVAVAREIKRIAKIDKGKGFDRDVELKLKTGEEPNNLRVIALLQESGAGKVIGATEQRPKE